MAEGSGYRETAEAGLLFYRARYYQPSVGRFTQEDPLSYDSGSTALYTYVGGQPTTSIDPTGLAADLILFGKDDPLYESAQNMSPVPGTFVVAGHGNPWQGVFLGLRTKLTAAELASLIRNSGWKKGTPIRLMSCRVGKSRIPQELARILKVPVEAPDGRVWFWPDGRTYISPVGHSDRSPLWNWSYDEFRERFSEGHLLEFSPNGSK